MAWIYLILAVLVEIGFTTFLNLSHNFTRLWPTLAFMAAAMLSFFLLSLSLRQIPLGTAYAVWTGIGAFGTALVGILYFDESTDFWKIFFLFLLILSIIGLKWVATD